MFPSVPIGAGADKYPWQLKNRMWMHIVTFPITFKNQILPSVGFFLFAFLCIGKRTVLDTCQKYAHTRLQCFRPSRTKVVAVYCSLYFIQFLGRNGLKRQEGSLYSCINVHLWSKLIISIFFQLKTQACWLWLIYNFSFMRICLLWSFCFFDSDFGQMKWAFKTSL